jgi:hypothetical protein
VKDLYLCPADQSGKEEARLKPLLNLHKSCELRKERRSRFQQTFSVLSKGFIPATVIAHDPHFCYDGCDRFYWQQAPYRFPQIRSSMTGRQEQALQRASQPYHPVQSSADNKAWSGLQHAPITYDNGGQDTNPYAHDGDGSLVKREVNGMITFYG